MLRKAQSTRCRQVGEEGVQVAGTASAKVLGQERTQPARISKCIQHGWREEEMHRGHSQRGGHGEGPKAEQGLDFLLRKSSQFLTQLHFS